MSLELVVKIEASELVNALREFVATVTKAAPQGQPNVSALTQPAPAIPVQVAPVTPPASPALTAVPTTAPTYTLEQLAVAATSLVDAGKRQEIVTLLGTFSVAALTQLPKDRYGEFATALRQMGAKI